MIHRVAERGSEVVQIRVGGNVEPKLPEACGECGFVTSGNGDVGEQIDRVSEPLVTSCEIEPLFSCADGRLRNAGDRCPVGDQFDDLTPRRRVWSSTYAEVSHGEPDCHARGRTRTGAPDTHQPDALSAGDRSGLRDIARLPRPR